MRSPDDLRPFTRRRLRGTMLDDGLPGRTHRADRRHRRDPSVAMSPPGRASGGAVPHRPPKGHVSHAPGAGAPPAGGEPMAELTGSAADARPYPPGDYP